MQPRPTDAPASRLRLFGSIAAVYILPVVLLRTGLIPYVFRFYVLIATAIFGTIFAKVTRQHSGAGLGFSRPGLVAFLLWSIVPSVLLAAILLSTDLPHRLLATPRAPFYVFFVLLSAPMQEFLYRSLLFAELSAAGLPSAVIVFISAGLYSFMHTIAHDPVTTALTFLVGLIWAAIFLRTRNFYIVALSHAGLGAVAITLGVI